MIVIGWEELVTLWSTTTSLYGDEIPTNDLAITLTTTISSATVNDKPIDIVHASAAREYVSSMTDEELDDLLLRISDKEIEITYEQDREQVNVKKLSLMKDNGRKH